MTEADWLACEAPQRMLNACVANFHHISDRKLRLWVEACRQASTAVSMVWSPIAPQTLQGVVNSWASEIEEATLPLAQRAALLREIVGNPWLPMKLDCCPRCQRMRRTATGQDFGTCQTCYGVGGIAPWLTRTVVSLGKAAYEERVRECEECGGIGSFAADDYAPAGECSRCHGTGTVNDGTLDPHRLAVLADALEEARCTDEELLGHLRWERRYPHVRGCWAVSLLLGQE